WQIMNSASKRAIALGLIFAGLVSLFGILRHEILLSSYDHGLFSQLFWNNLQGNWFQSSLTSGNSVESLQDGVIPRVDFIHLGQHWVVDFLLWWPIYAIAPHPITLIFLQTGLMTVGGWLLYALARCSLSPQLSLWILGSYYAANAVIGPSLANFYEHCQIPLFAFGMFLTWEKKRWGWFALCVAFLLGIREEVGGMILFSYGLYLSLSRRSVKLGVLLCAIAFAYVAVITNWVLPQFSTDNSRLYLATRFRQFVDTPNPSTLQVLWGMITRPGELLKSLFWPIDRRLAYVARHWLPLGFASLLSPMTWTLTGVPLISLFMQTGISALSISLRYSLVVVPGLFYGTILWWAAHPRKFTPQFRKVWAIGLVLSILLSVTSNPNRAFSWLIPDSFRPWVHTSLSRAWFHAAVAREVLRQIPPQASVSATTYLIPHLANRRALLRFPKIQIQDGRDRVLPTDYWVADFWQLRQYQVAFEEERTAIALIVPLYDEAIESGEYGILEARDGLVLLGRGYPSQPGTVQTWKNLRASLVAPQ
ncbi:MAG: DUF2079 domain-containing protein, partial [Synechococcales bacterium]|nr:DUF2079 domain-containing protein [Synechococcales bacterium]